MFQKVIYQLKKIREKGSFARHVSISSSWNIFNFLAQFVLSPIITRLYGPEQYGIAALFNSIVINVVMISSFRYHETIIIANSKKQLSNAISLSFLLVTLISLLTVLVVYIFQNAVLSFLGAPWLGPWLYAIPVSIFFSGVMEIALMVNVRRNKFFNNGLAGFIMNLSSRLFVIGFAYFQPATVKGLIGGDFVGKISGLSCVLSSIRKLKKKVGELMENVSLKGMVAMARVYRHFPLYNLPTNLLANFSGHIPIFFFQYQFSSSIVGSYALASSLLEIINRLIPYSVAAVLFPKAMEMKRTSVSHLLDGVYRIFWVMIGGAILIFSAVAIITPTLFPWIFGSKWVLAGTFSSILSLQYALGFVSLTIAEVYKVVGRQRLLLVLTIVSVGLKVIAVILSLYLEANEKNALLIYSIAGALGSLIQAYGIFLIFRYKIWKVGGALVGITAIIFFAVYFRSF